MRIALRWFFRLLLLALLAIILLVAHSLLFKPLKPNWFYERVFLEFGIQDPQMLSSMRMLPSWMDWYSDDLTDQSLAQEKKMQAKLKQDLATLQKYDRKSMNEADALNYDMLNYFLEIQAEGEKYSHHNYPLNQLFGIQNEFPTYMATQHPVESVKDAENYLARLNKAPEMASQVMEGLLVREQEKILPPTFVVEKVLKEMRAFVAVPPKQNILYSSLVEKFSELKKNEISTEQQKQLLAETETAIREKVYPAYAKFISYYETLQPKTTGNHGVWALPDGDAYYAYAVKMHTTTDMTPEQVHQLGLSEVARIEAEMDAILRAEGLTMGSVGARMQGISKRPDQLYPDTDAGRAQIINDFQTIINDINNGLTPYFNSRPKMGVDVERVPEFREKTAPGAYYNPPAFDGSRPGVFYINLRNTAEVAKFGMRTLAYHEGIPGHHFQIALQQELTGVPTFRKVLPFTAYAEGWALYSERLAWEAGFQKAPLDNLGRLQAEMFRSVRLVVDTGMHYKQWTREQAIAYMLEKTGMPETDVVAEIERYLVMPGQALAYKVGMNKILELRERAKTELGSKFDIKAFHDVVLTGGSMPMALLEQRVDQWIVRQKSAL
ncbi:MAG: DUF885 domain-containing protein [Arenimonas sp.]|nr:DUF885 domain-containing protein [Arenimonas sp.]MBP6310033.1 DUF885 domain-containing protein [Arenimonas sp.]